MITVTIKISAEVNLINNLRLLTIGDKGLMMSRYLHTIPNGNMPNCRMN